MLPLGVRQGFLLSENPLVGRLLAARGTKAAFATEANFLLMAAIGVATAMRRIAHHVQPAAKHFDHVLNDRVAECVGMLGEVLPPGIVRLEQLFDRADEPNGRLTKRE
jgi:hypothetical protein